MTTPAGAAVRVLVVEDFDQLRDTLMRGLRPAGFAVDGAGSMEEALSLHPEAYDVVVADQRLGDALGTDLFRILHGRDPGVASRFILMTADERDLALPATVPVLVKPFRLAELVEAVRGMPGGGGPGPGAADGGPG